MRISLFAAVAAGLTLIPVAAYADLTGATINTTYFYPDQNTVFANLGNFTAPGGGAVPDGRGGTLGTYFVSGNQVTITSDEAQNFPAATFDGFTFTDVSGDPMITGITLDNSSTLFDAVGTFTSNSVSVNLAGLGQVSAGDQVTFDLTFAPANSVTPEPSSLVLLGTGALGVMGVARRRFARL